MKKSDYRAIHTAIKAVYGSPRKCELCKGANKSKRFEWSNKNHRYGLKKSDWWELCATCHRQWDRKKFGHKTWNKGIKGRQNWHNTSGFKGIPWNKGKKTGLVPKSAFKKGNKPWNKNNLLSPTHKEE